MRPVEVLALVSVLILEAGFYPAIARAEGEPGTTLRVMTFNVWHGLRSGESRKRFPGEESERMEERLAWQIEEIRRLDPDVLLFQEVNPNQRQARRYAEALGYDEIHKVTSCGLHLGALFKIPKNVNEGLAILAKPEFGLRRVGKKRLSGNAMCTASWGFQTKESRYGLFGRIIVDGRHVLVATTHLSSPAFVLPDFDQQLEALVTAGVLTQEQHDEIQAVRETKSRRNLDEAEKMLREITRRASRLNGSDAVPIIFGGDFNAEPETSSVEAVLAAGYEQAGTGRDLHTWDPITNHENYRIGTRRHDPLPTFDRPEVEELLEHRATTPRQIDHLFVRNDFEIVSAEMVMNRDKDGLYPSDHFGIMATLTLPPTE